MRTFQFIDSSKNFPTCQGIYAIKGLHNNFHLVGQTRQTLRARWSQHRQKLRQNKHDNPYLQNSFNKYGETNFVFILIEDISSDFDSKEVFWIKELNSMKNKSGWNLREGGAYGIYSKELREKVSQGIRNSQAALKSRLDRAKTYTLISPNQERIIFTNRNKFCRDNNLSAASLWKLLNKKNGMTQHKGWTLPKGI